MTREQVIKRLAEHYSELFEGKVWAGYDDSKRAYYIQGEGLPAKPELRDMYPNGWSLLSYLKPSEARRVIQTET